MILYLSIIIICMCVIAVANYFLGVYASLFNIALWVVLATLLEIVIDSIFATISRWVLPKKWFAVENKSFVPGKKEVRFYENIGIRKWKDKTLELGAVTGFRKNKLGDAGNIEYVERFIVEANYGIIVHVLCIIFGFAVMFLTPYRYWFSIGIPVGFVNACLNCMSLFILRYNLPKLHALYKFNFKKLQKQNKE